MKNWLIPAVVLIAVGAMGLGVGWSLNDWQGDDEAAPTPTATERAGPTQAEREAEDVRLCLEAQQAAAAQEAAYHARHPERLGSGVDTYVRLAIQRYCH